MLWGWRTVGKRIIHNVTGLAFLTNFTFYLYQNKAIGGFDIENLQDSILIVFNHERQNIVLFFICELKGKHLWNCNINKKIVPKFINLLSSYKDGIAESIHTQYASLNLVSSFFFYIPWRRRDNCSLQLPTSFALNKVCIFTIIPGSVLPLIYTNFFR